MDTSDLAPAAEARRDALVERMTKAMLAANELLAVYLGDRLGYYRALADGGPATSAELATRTGTHERYAREWLEQQAVAGILECEGADAAATARRFRLPAGHDEALVDPTSLHYVAPFAAAVVTCSRPLPQLLGAYRTGTGVPFAAYGDDVGELTSAMTRPLYVNLLGKEWLPRIPDVHARLQTDPPARVADIGMGGGWSSIAIAEAYPKALVDGFDLHAPSVELARANAAAAGVADRVTFHVRDAGDPDLAGRYDLAIAIECIHDMSDPVAALEAMRRLVGSNGSVLVLDQKVADEFVAPGDDTERMVYAVSLVHCLPVGMARQPSAATGAVMRASTLRRYAEAAGFREVEILPVADDWFRVYRLTG